MSTCRVTCTNTCMHACGHTDTCRHRQAYTYLYMYTHTYDTHAHAHTHVRHTRTRTYTYVHTYTHIYTHTHIHTHAHTDTDTDTHTQLTTDRCQGQNMRGRRVVDQHVQRRLPEHDPQTYSYRSMTWLQRAEKKKKKKKKKKTRQECNVMSSTERSFDFTQTVLVHSGTREWHWGVALGSD